VARNSIKVEGRVRKYWIEYVRGDMMDMGLKVDDAKDRL